MLKIQSSAGAKNREKSVKDNAEDRGVGDKTVQCWR